LLGFGFIEEVGGGLQGIVNWASVQGLNAVGRQDRQSV